MNIREISLITLGNSKVGKSSYILRYTDNRFSMHISTTIGMECMHKYETLESGERVKVIIFDTNGQERFRSISSNMIKRADGVLLFYDITDRDSFESVKDWMLDIYNIKAENFPIVLIGNKIDKEKERVVKKEEGEAEALKYNKKFFEISCKNDINIINPILHLISKISDNEHGKEKIRLGPKEKNDKKCCQK